jgi:hypothetical protein
VLPLSVLREQTLWVQCHAFRIRMIPSERSPSANSVELAGSVKPDSDCMGLHSGGAVLQAALSLPHELMPRASANRPAGETWACLRRDAQTVTLESHEQFSRLADRVCPACVTRHADLPCLRLDAPLPGSEEYTPRALYERLVVRWQAGSLSAQRQSVTPPPLD